MEMLHALLMRPRPGQTDDVPRQLGLLTERLPALPELLVARFFRSREEAHTYLALTTWDLEAEGKVSEENVLGDNGNRLAIQPPEQLSRLVVPGLAEVETEEWFFHYLWGYSRAGLEGRHALVLVASAAAGLEAQLRQGWLDGLRTLAAETPLGQGYLARSIPQEAQRLPAPVMFCFLGCSSEQAAQALRSHPLYEQLLNWISRFAQVRLFEFAPLSPDYRAPG